MTEIQQQRPKPPRHSPSTIHQVEPQDYSRAVENVIRRTGLSHEQAERLVCAVLAPLLLAPDEPVSAQGPLDDEPKTVLNVCQWAYVHPNGNTIYCDSGDVTDADGKATPHDELVLDGDHYADYVATSWTEDDPRAIHLPTWRGETCED